MEGGYQSQPGVQGQPGGQGQPGAPAQAGYAGPPATANQPESAVGPRAGFGKRLLAIILDGVLLAVVNTIVGAILGAALGDSGAALGTALSILIAIAYFGILEGGERGQTLGKRALGIRVIDFNAGGPIGIGRAVIRYLARILSSIPLLLGYFWMLWDPQSQTWHDKLSTAVVVPESAYPIGR